MRSSFLTRLVTQEYPTELIHNILQELDIISSGYRIERACTDIITIENIPDIVKNYCAALAIENKAFGTIVGYKRKLVEFFKCINKPFEEITPNDIRLFLHWKQQTHNVSKSTIEQHRIAINAFFNWVVDEGQLNKNPARKIKPIDVPEAEREPLSPIELEYLRQCCKTLRETALVDFLYSTGVRVSECAAVELSDIDWRERAVKIHHGKGDKPRTVYFSAKTEVSLRAYIDAKKHETPVLFSRTRAPYGHITRESIEHVIKDIAARAGNKISVPVTPHVLRHTFATNAIESGMPVEQLQMLLGHSSLDTTMIYVKRSQESLKTSHRKYIT